MASPQTENGHTRLADELLDALIRHPFSKRQYKIILAVIRKTYGFSKLMDDIASSQLAEMTGIGEANCRRTVIELEAMQVLTTEPGRYGKKIRLNKDYEQWCVKLARAKTTRSPCQNGTAGVPKQHVQACQNDTHNKHLPIDSSNTTTTVEAIDPLASSACGGDLVYPCGLDAREQRQAQELVEPLNGQAQDVLDELAGLMRLKQIRVSPIACLRGMVRKAQEGLFTFEAGESVRKAREQPEKEAEHPPEPSTDDVIAEHARLLGIPVEEYRERIGANA
jgi:phage replication O-like protein O